VEKLTAPEATAETTIVVKLRVLDSANAVAEGETKLTVRPK